MSRRAFLSHRHRYLPAGLACLLAVGMLGARGTRPLDPSTTIIRQVHAADTIPTDSTAAAAPDSIGAVFDLLLTTTDTIEAALDAIAHAADSLPDVSIDSVEAAGDTIAHALDILTGTADSIAKDRPADMPDGPVAVPDGLPDANDLPAILPDAVAVDRKVGAPAQVSPDAKSGNPASQPTRPANLPTPTPKNDTVHTEMPEALRDSSATQQQRKTRVDLLYADEARADDELSPDMQILVGSVRLKHDDMYMYCDSALIFRQINSVEAFGNVRMEQGDTLFIFGDYLYYDGTSRIAILRDNVRLINQGTELTTDSLNYDRVFNLGYYFEGGTLTDEENVLTSIWGEYCTATKLSVFNHEVTLTNPNFVLTSDTLKYSTLTKVATILGPTDIVSDQNHIYSERGTYDTNLEQAVLLDRSVVNHISGKRLTGDSLFYDRLQGYGEAFDRVVMIDSLNRNMLRGDYCFFNELTEGAFATRRAEAIDFSQGDSLFLHGDTLRLITYNLNTDSVYRELHAYHHVRAYRTDVQAICDSMVYISRDSCLTMYEDPIVWTGSQQLLGEEIKIYMNDSTIDWAHIINQALAVEMKDTVHYNQVSGKEMRAYFREGELRQVDVNTNVYVIYYPQEEGDTTLMMNNYSEGSVLKMYLRDRRMERGIFVGAANGMLYPMDQIPKDRFRLPSFAWFDYARPRNKYDIFEWRGKHAEDKLKKTDRAPVASPKSLHIERTRK